MTRQLLCLDTSDNTRLARTPNIHAPKSDM